MSIVQVVQKMDGSYPCLGQAGYADRMISDMEGHVCVTQHNRQNTLLVQVQNVRTVIHALGKLDMRTAWSLILAISGKGRGGPNSVGLSQVRLATLSLRRWEVGHPWPFQRGGVSVPTWACLLLGNDYILGTTFLGPGMLSRCRLGWWCCSSCTGGTKGPD
jgi:hypothetical protein